MSDKPHTQKPNPALTVVDKLRLMLDITRKISRSLDQDEVLTLVMDTLGSLIPYDAAGIYLVDCPKDDHETPCSFTSAALKGYHLGDLADPKIKVGEGFIGHVAQTGKTILSHDVSKDDRYFPARQRTRSEMVVPIVSNDEVVGVFDLESDHLNAYDEDDLQVLIMLSTHVAIIIEKVELHEQVVEKKRLQAQLEVARQVQLELLPDSDPIFPGFDISGYNFPTEEVSGDYYDWVKIFEDQVGIVVADAAGKGIPAALLAAFLRASLRSAAQTGYAPHVAMARVNNLLWESIEEHQFVTAIYGILDTTNKTFVFSNAGHNPPLMINESGETRTIQYGDLPLGMFRDMRYHQHFLRFRPGDTLVIYTDGITEAANGQGEEFGRERLGQKILEHIQLPAKQLVEQILQEVVTFAGNENLEDDWTLFVIKNVTSEKEAAGK
jgi:sigma-B regulation protein RsbU (phosphoserine phosphatase)